MAEPSLSLKLSDLQARVGTFLGWGTDPTGWAPSQSAVITDCVQSGLRRFYYPVPIEGERTSYDWSFMKPTATLDFPQGAQTIPLPDDFGGFEDVVTVLTTGTTSQPWELNWRNESFLRRLYSMTPTMTGPPVYVAEQCIKGTTSQAGQRFQMFVFPTADQDYTFQVQYYVNPDYITTAAPFALGGQQHVETILEACLSVAEERMDDASTVHASAFMQRLMASVGMDRKNKPQKLGYCRDRSDWMDRSPRDGWWHYDAPAATYNGNPFG